MRANAAPGVAVLRPYGRGLLQSPSRMKPEPDLPRRRSVRLPEYDYAQPGAYFVTICAHQKKHLFGEISGDAMTLSGPGKIVDECLREIPAHFPGAKVPMHVVMPNHVHGIVVIADGAQRSSRVDGVNGAARRLGAHRAASLPVIIRSFKAISARRIRERFGVPPSEIWQRGYYERVIRTREEFGKTWEYIRLNPVTWSNDSENPGQGTAIPPRAP